MYPIGLPLLVCSSTVIGHHFEILFVTKKNTKKKKLHSPNLLKVLPGGHCGTRGTAYGNVTDHLLSLAASRSDEKFAVWGTCQGFQQLAQFASNYSRGSILHQTDSEDLALPLNITVCNANTCFN